jgi:hypothetical protein
MMKAIESRKVSAYENQMSVYGKKEDPHGNKVITYKNEDGRTIHWVPEVQK